MCKNETENKIKEGDFPKPIKLGMRAVAWLEADIAGWIAAKVEKAKRA
jgi:prophage regulatory protein